MQYVALGYKDRIIEPVLWDPPESVLDFLGSLADSLANLGQPVTTVGTGIRLLCSSGTGIGRGNIFERVELSEGGVAFRSIAVNRTYGLYEYVRADQGALWLLPMEAPGSWETFREIELGDYFALETAEGLFVTAEGDGDGSPLAIDRDQIGEWQQFRYNRPPQELLPEAPPPEPSLGEQALTPVNQAQTEASGIPPSPLGGVQEAQTDMERPRGLRDKIFRRFR